MDGGGGDIMQETPTQKSLAGYIVNTSSDAVMFADRRGIIRDVSPRWQREKELKERIKTLEAGSS